MLSQIGPYFIDEELASGGMARVFKGRLRGLGGFEKTLVIKQVRRELARDPVFVEMFVKEANTLVSLSHPHIVPVYELFSADGGYFLSMEYVEGATIAQLLALGPLAPTLVAHVAAQICDALDYAHRTFNILHRDVTPRNILVDSAGHARLLDFGIAGVGGSVSEQVLGSPGYVAPEQVAGEPLSDATDLFSLGAVLFEALRNESAFPATTTGTLLPFSTARLRDLPPTLAALLAQLLARSPADRPSSAREVGRTLRAFLAAEAPHGVLDAMQHAVAEARAVRTPSTPSSEPADAAHTLPVPSTSLATSPVLTQILRTAGGSPMPTPPRAPAASEPPAIHGTRKIRERTGGAGPGGALWTRWGLRVWPGIAVATLSLLGVLAVTQKRHGPRQAADTRAANDAGSAHDVAVMASEAAVPALRTLSAAEDASTSAPTVGEERPELVPDSGARAAPSNITINAEPWAEVSIDGRPQGTTPLRNLHLKPGVRRIELRCPPLGTHSEIRLDVAPGDRGSLRVQLQQNPARTFLDGLREVR